MPGLRPLLKENVEDSRSVTRILLMSSQESFGIRFSQIKIEPTSFPTFLDRLVELDQRSSKVCSDSSGKLTQTMEPE